MSKTAINELDVVERARKYLDFHKNPKTREKMDSVLADLCREDQQRVVFTAQRMSRGLDLKLKQVKVNGSAAPEPPPTKKQSRPEKEKPAAKKQQPKSKGKKSRDDFGAPEE